MTQGLEWTFECVQKKVEVAIFIGVFWFLKEQHRRIDAGPPATMLGRDASCSPS
jgi:hypothetical protein